MVSAIAKEAVDAMLFSEALERVLPLGDLEPAGPPRGTTGGALSAARRARGLSIDQLSRATRISGRYLEALEEGDLDAFAGSIYAVGFTRAYAREVGVDESWAVETVRAEIAARRPHWRRAGWV